MLNRRFRGLRSGLAALAALASWKTRATVTGVLVPALPGLSPLLPQALLMGASALVLVLACFVWTLLRPDPGVQGATGPGGRQLERPDPPGGEATRSVKEVEMSVFHISKGPPPLPSAGTAKQQIALPKPGHPQNAEADDAPAKQGVRGLDLEFLDNLDFHHLRLRLSYRGDAGESAQVRYYLHHARLDAEQVEWVPAQQIEAQPAAYGWPGGAAERLCQRGLRLDAQQPSCVGVVRVAAQRSSRHGASTPLSFYASTTQPNGLAGEDAFVEHLPGTLRARRGLAIKEVFFVSFASLGFVGSALYMVQRDAQNPDLWTRTYLHGFGNGETLTLPMQRLEHMQLSRDGSRLYLSTPHRVFEWTGGAETPPMLRLQVGGGNWLGPMAMIDGRVCMLEGTGNISAALRCSNQGSDQWDPPQVLPLPVREFPEYLMEPYAMAALGNSLLIVDQQWRSLRPLLGAWVPDASLPWPAMHVVGLLPRDANPGRVVLGVLGVSPRAKLPQQFVLHGYFSGSRDALQVASLYPGVASGMVPPRVDVGPSFSAGRSIQQSALLVLSWYSPRAEQVRIFSADHGLTSDYYDLRRARAVSHTAYDAPQGWHDHGAAALLEADDGSRTLALGGSHDAGGSLRAGVLMRHVPHFAAAPGAARILYFDQQLAQLLPGPTAIYYVEHLSRNTLLLAPRHPRAAPD